MSDYQSRSTDGNAKLPCDEVVEIIGEGGLGLVLVRRVPSLREGAVVSVGRAVEYGRSGIV